MATRSPGSRADAVRLARPRGRPVGRTYGWSDGQGQFVICGDGDADNPYPFDQWACAGEGRDGDGLPDIGCRAYDDGTNSAEPGNTYEFESCLIPITG